MIRYLLMALLLSGCSTATYLPKSIISEWFHVQSDPDFIKNWEGMDPNGDYIAFEFQKGNACTWIIDDKQVSCHYRYTHHQNGIRLEIHKMEGEQFKDVQFISWVKVKGKEMMIYGYPTRYGQLQSGEPAWWPDKFGKESILLTLREGKRMTVSQ